MVLEMLVNEAVKQRHHNTLPGCNGWEECYNEILVQLRLLVVHYENGENTDKNDCEENQYYPQVQYLHFLNFGGLFDWFVTLRSPSLAISGIQLLQQHSTPVSVNEKNILQLQVELCHGAGLLYTDY